jgi:hypothetical protein
MLLSVKPVSSLMQNAKGRSMSLNAAITKLLKTAPLEKMGLVAFMLFVQLANRLQDEGALDELELAKMLKDASQGMGTEAQDAAEFSIIWPPRSSARRANFKLRHYRFVGHGLAAHRGCRVGRRSRHVGADRDHGGARDDAVRRFAPRNGGSGAR